MRTPTESESSQGLDDSSDLPALPISGASLSDDDFKTYRKDYVPKIRDITIPLPKRHKSLIGHRKEIDFYSSNLNLTRKPCNLYELRICKKLSNFIDHVYNLTKIYHTSSKSDRFIYKQTLNFALRLNVRSCLEFNKPLEKPRIYSPNLPFWLYRGITRALARKPMV